MLAVRGLIDQQAVKAIPTRQQGLVMREMLAQNGVDQRVVETHCAQPLQVRVSPRVAGAGPNVIATQQQLGDAMPTAHQVAAQILSAADEIAQSLQLL